MQKWHDNVPTRLPSIACTCTCWKNWLAEALNWAKMQSRKIFPTLQWWYSLNIINSRCLLWSFKDLFDVFYQLQKKNQFQKNLKMKGETISVCSQNQWVTNGNKLVEINSTVAKLLTHCLFHGIWSKLQRIPLQFLLMKEKH